MMYLNASQAELIGFVAAFCTTAAFVSQLLSLSILVLKLRYDRRTLEKEARVEV